MVQQFVVQLENRPGALARLARALAVRGVNIEQIAGGGAGPLGYAVLTTNDDATTREVLRSSGYRFVEGQSLIVEIEDRPGTLADVTERLADAGIQILGVLVVGRRGPLAEIALSVDDVPRARRVLGLD
jgi:hypothetical protein